MAQIITSKFIVSSGVVLNDLSVQTNEGFVTVQAGGKVTGSEAVNSGMIFVEASGTVETTRVASSGGLFVSGAASNLTAETGGEFEICGSLQSASILGGGVGVVYAGGTGTKVTVSGGNYMLYGGAAENTTVQNGGVIAVQLETGLANLTTIEAGGSARVISGGAMSKTNLSGKLDLLEGTVQETQILAGGSLAMSAGELRKTTVNNGAGVEVSSGTAYETEILAGGAMKVLALGEISTATVNGGELNVAGSAGGITVKAGELTVSSGGTVESLSVEGGIVHLNEAGVLAGAISVAEGAQIIVLSGGTVKFDVTETEPEADAPVFGLSRITGSPTFTLTVKSDQAQGIYRLAADAAEFTGSISVGTAKKNLGTISLSDYIKVGSLYYSLQMSGDNLYFSISPDVPVPPQDAVYVNTDWTGLDDGTQVDITEEVKATIGLNAFAEGSPAMNAASMDGTVTVLKGTLGFLYGISRNTIAVDGVVIENSTVTKNGVLTLNSGATGNNLNVAGFGALNVESGATLTVGAENSIAGYAVFAEGSTVTVNGTVAFDTAIAKSDEAQIQVGTAIGGKAKFTLKDTALTAGTYLLVSGVETFEDPVQFGDHTLTTADAEATPVGFFTYKLSVTENKELALTVAEYVPPPAETVYVNSEWIDKYVGQQFEAVEGVTVTFGYDAFATGDAALENVAEGGAIQVVGGNISFHAPLDTVKTTVVRSGAAVIGASVSASTLTVAEGGTVKNISVASPKEAQADPPSEAVPGGTLSVAAGGIVTGQAIFNPGSTITIDGTVAFDTAYAKSDEAQIQVGGAVGGKAKFTLKDTALTVGTYLLVSGVETFEDPVQFGGYTLTTADKEATPVGDFTYRLSVTENKELALTVAEYVPPPMFYVNAEWAGLEDGQTVDIGTGTPATIGVDAFATGDAAVAFIGGDTSISRILVFLSDGSAETLVGFDSITVNANSIVSLGGTFTGKSITIDATAYADFSKLVLTSAGGFAGDVSISVVGEGFGHAFLGDNDLLITSTLVSDTFANADWTQEDVNGKLSDRGISLVWETNAFNSPAAAAAALGVNGTLHLEGGTSTEPVLLTTAANDVIVTANTVGTVVGSVTGAGGVLTVENEFTADAISGFSLLTVKAGQLGGGAYSYGSVSVMVSISLAENGTLNFDLTNFTIKTDPELNTPILNAPLIVDLSLVSGTPKYTLTVSEDQAWGEYRLASGAAVFSGSVMLDDTELAVGAEAVVIGKNAYSLAIKNDDLILTIGDRPDPGIVYVNSEWSALEPETKVTVGETTAWVGYNAFGTGDEANAAVTDGGTIRIVDGAASFSSAANNIVVSGGAQLRHNSSVMIANVSVLADGEMVVKQGALASDIQVSSGGVVDVEQLAVLTGRLAIEDGATVTMNDTSFLKFDVSGLKKAGNVALVNKFSAIKGTPYLSVRVSEETQSFGSYLLAESVTSSSFSSSREVTLLNLAGESLGTLTVNGEAITEGNRKYSLARANQKLTLTVSSAVPGPDKPMIVYVNNEWADLYDGETVTIGDVEAMIGVNAFADYADASGKVAEGGSIELIGGDVTFDGPIENAVVVHNGVTVTGASVSTGSLTVEPGGTVITVDVAATGTLTVDSGGTITGTAVFADGAAITINGSVLFDTVYAQNGAVQFAGCSAIAGKASFEMKDSVKAEGTYFFVSGIEKFEDPVQFDVYTLKVGDDPVRVGKFTYKLGVTDDKLALTVAKYTPSGDAPGTVYVNPAWATLTSSTVVPVGEGTATVGFDAFADGDTANASVASGGEIQLVNGAASFSEDAQNVIVSSGAELDLGSAVNLAKLTVLGGGRMVAAGGAVVDGFTLSGGNIAAEVSGATMKNGIVSGLTYEAGGSFHWCSMTVNDGGLVQSAAVGTGGAVLVSSGGSAEQITLTGPDSGWDYGELAVYSGGKASGVTVSSAGYLTNNGVIDDLTIQDGQGYTRGVVNGAVVRNGTLGVEAGGSATGVKVGAGGNMWAVNSGGIGTILDTEVQSGGSLSVQGYASGTHILGGGSMNLSYHGIAEATTVESGGYFSVGPYATARGLTLADGGTVTVSGNTSGSSGYAVVTGVITTGEGATIAMGMNTRLDFDISVLAEPNEAPLLNDYAAIDGTPELFITVSAEQEVGTYLLAGGIDEEGFDKTFTVKTAAGDTLGEISVFSDPLESGDYVYNLGFMDGGIIALAVGSSVKVDDGPDDGWNDVLWNAKEKKPNMDLFLSEATVLDNGTTSVPVDTKNSVSVKRPDGITYSNFVGKISDPAPGQRDADPADYRKIKLETGARLSFSVTGQSSGKLVIYQIVESAKDESVTYNRKTLQTTKLSLKKNNANVTVVSKAIYLEAGTYFLAMEGAIAKKGDTNGFYNVELNYIDPAVDARKQGTKFYADDDNGDNNWLYDKKEKAINAAVYDAESLHISAGSVIQLDAAVLDKTHIDEKKQEHVYTNFVGFGDSMDIRKIELDCAAELSFVVDTFGSAATGNAKICLYQVAEGKNKKGETTYTVKTLTPPTAAVKMPKKVTEYDNSFATKPALLEQGVYFVAVQSTAKSDGEVYYNVSVDADSMFYLDDDNGDNNYLYDKKLGWGKVVESEASLLTVGDLHIDAAAPTHTTGDWANFVGSGDAGDVLRIQANAGMTVTFKIDAADAVSFVICERFLKKGAYTQKALSTTKLTAKNGFSDTVTYTFKNDGDFYVGVMSANAKKGSEAYYNVAITGISGQNADSRSDAPQFAGLAMPDGNEFGSQVSELAMPGLETGAVTAASGLADAALSEDRTVWQNIASLA